MEQSAPRISRNFPVSKGGDIVFRSSDNVLFYLHKKNLEYSTGGFPAADSVQSRKEIVPLTEPASTLEILFQFIYPQRHPSLDDLNWVTFSSVAEAAEKYEVFNAMNVCQIRMKDYIPKYAPQIFGFAAKHDYPNTIASVAPFLVGKPLDEVAETLPYYMYVPWTIYQQHYTKTTFFALNRVFVLFKSCPAYPSHTDKLHRTASILSRVMQHDPSRLTRFAELINEIGENPNPNSYLNSILNGQGNENGSNAQVGGTRTEHTASSDPNSPNSTLGFSSLVVGAFVTESTSGPIGRLVDIECKHCQISQRVTEWIEEVEREVANVPDFLTFLKRYRAIGEV